MYKNSVVIYSLLRDIELDEEAAATILEFIKKAAARAERAAHSREDLEVLAFNVIRLFNAIEHIFGLIAKDMDESVPGGTESHKDLLRQMATALPGKRPAVVDMDTIQALDDLRALRHALIHSYRDSVEWDKMAATIKAVPEGLKRLRRDLHAFRTALLTIAQSIDAQEQGREIPESSL